MHHACDVTRVLQVCWFRHCSVMFVLTMGSRHSPTYDMGLLRLCVKCLGQGMAVAGRINQTAIFASEMQQCVRYAMLVGTLPGGLGTILRGTLNMCRLQRWEVQSLCCKEAWRYGLYVLTVSQALSGQLPFEV